MGADVDVGEDALDLTCFNFTGGEVGALPPENLDTSAAKSIERFGRTLAFDGMAGFGVGAPVARGYVDEDGNCSAGDAGGCFPWETSPATGVRTIIMEKTTCQVK